MGKSIINQFFQLLESANFKSCRKCKYFDLCSKNDMHCDKALKSILEGKEDWEVKKGE